MGKFIRQTYVLLKKNLLLHARNRTSTVAQIGIGMMLCLALVIMQAVIDMNQQYNEAFVEAKHPQLEDATRMVPCISHVGECYTFVYAPNDTVSTEIARSTATIGGIPNTEQEFGIRGFGTTKEMNDFIVQNPNTTGMAVTFKNPTEWNQTTSNRVVNLFDYELQLNETRICRELGVFKCNNPYVELRAPLQTALDSAFIRKYGQGNVNEAKISVHISDFPHPDLPISFYVMDEYGQIFFYMIMVFNFVVQSMLVVMEKEKKLKASMRQMGMLESSYWLSWHLCFTIMNTLMVLLLSIFGAIVQLDFFIQNNFFLYFTFLCISAQSFTSFAMLLASFFKTTDRKSVV